MKNPKGRVGRMKPRFSLLPWEVMTEIIGAFSEGEAKYGDFNWRGKAGVDASVYFDAAMRHIVDWWTGTDIDKESKLDTHHLIKAISNFIIILDAASRGTLVDNRPTKCDEPFLENLTIKLRNFYTVLEDKSNGKTTGRHRDVLGNGERGKSSDGLSAWDEPGGVPI